MAVTLDDVRHIALLARLGLDETRAASLVEQLNGILGHMDVLSRVDTSGVGEATAAGLERMPLRADGGPPFPLQRPPVDFAPEMRDGFLVVPRLATHENEEGE